MKKISRLFVISLTLTMLILTFAGCSTKENIDNKQPEQNQTTSNSAMNEINGWEVAVLETELTDNLSDTSTSIGYGGDITSQVYEQKPTKEGNKFCLVKFQMDKKNANDVIKWDNCVLLDQDNNEYKRIDDSFLEDVGFKRLKSSDVNFGENMGWVSYEVPGNVSSLKIKLTIGEIVKEIPLTID